MMRGESWQGPAVFVLPAAIVSLAIAAVPLLFILYTSVGGSAFSLEALSIRINLHLPHFVAPLILLPRVQSDQRIPR